MSIISSIQQTSTDCMKDTTPPSKLGVTAYFGDMRLSHTIDPLYLEFRGVEPGAKIELINLSANPAAVWSEAKSLGANTMLAQADGSYRLALGNVEAKALGISPGDVLEFRQVDAAGNASSSTMIAMKQRTSSNHGSGLQVAPDEQRGVNLPRAWMQYVPYIDGRAPTALPARMKISAGQGEQGVLTGDRAIEPYAEVTVTNRRTLRSYQGKVSEAGALSVTFDAKVGDPLEITVTDHNGVKTNLGVAPYAPKCVKAGPLCAQQLQDQVGQAA